MQVIVVLQAIPPEYVHDAEGKRSVGAGTDRYPPVATGRRLAAVRVDGDDPGASLAGLVHDGPQVHVGDAGIRTPIDDVAGMDDGLGIDGGAGAQGHVATGGARGGTDGA